MGAIELLVVLAGAAVGWGWLERRRRAAVGTTPESKRGPADDLAMPFALGDVVVRAGDEAWLAGGLAVSERGEPLAIVFVAPERRSYRAVVAFAPPRDEALWLEPVSAPFGGEPPTTLEIGGTIYERTSRRPVTAERLGEHAPEVGERAIFSEFRGPGRAAVCTLTSSGDPLAWIGERVPLVEIERLPGS